VGEVKPNSFYQGRLARKGDHKREKSWIQLVAHDALSLVWKQSDETSSESAESLPRKKRPARFFWASEDSFFVGESYREDFAAQEGFA